MIQFRYRPDIDGLRGVAVLLVLLFHAGFGFSGGYIGVDVFFVISGFLITGLIAKQQREGRFQLGTFWVRRIRRIIPAALCMVVVTLLAGSLLLLPKDLELLARSAMSQQVMGSNVYFWLTTDYFAGPAETQPLLHTWSLAVEEQFYLFFPLLLVYCSQVSKRTLLLILGGLAGLSFVLSEWSVRSYPSATFYLLHTRMWELLLGALLTLAPSPRRIPKACLEIVSWTGLAGILAAGWIYDSTTAFPGFAALAPCLGTALVIYANSDRTTSLGSLLSHRGLVFVGLISYSLYLWHWPILAFQHYWLGQELSLSTRLLAVALSFCFAYVSWRFVETPFRRSPSGLRPRRAVFGASVSAVLIIGVSLAIHLFDGLTWRLPEEARKFVEGNKTPYRFRSDLANVRQHTLPRIGVPKPDGTIDCVIWGDSHAVALGELFDQLASEFGVSGVVAARSGTAPLPGTWRPSKGRDALTWNKEVLAFILENRVPNVILVSRWAVNVDGRPDGRLDSLLVDAESSGVSVEEARGAVERSLRRTLLALTQRGVRVWMIKQVPRQDQDPPGVLVRAVLLDDNTPTGISIGRHRKRQARANAILDCIASQSPSVHTLDPAEHCFDAFGNSRIGNRDGSFYADDDHLSPFGANYLLRPMFQSVFEEMAHSTRRVVRQSSVQIE